MTIIKLDEDMYLNNDPFPKDENDKIEILNNTAYGVYHTGVLSKREILENCGVTHKEMTDEEVDELFKKAEKKGIIL